MKASFRNIFLILVAVVVVTELNAIFFNLMTVLDSQFLGKFPNFGSQYIELLIIFLFLSIPEILAGLIVAKLLAGQFKIYWCLGLSIFLLWYYHPSQWVVFDMTFWGEVLSYIAYYLHPISLFMAAFIFLKLPNPSFKRDALKRAP